MEYTGRGMVVEKSVVCIEVVLGMLEVECLGRSGIRVKCFVVVG